MSVQMTCPYCKQEFPFDNGELDRKISTISQRISTINMELAHIKALSPRARKAAEGRRKVLVMELTELIKKVSGLKAIRKASDQQIKAYEYQAFRDIVKERYGEAEYMKIVSMVAEEIKAYKISGLMRHEYTRSHHKIGVTNVSKL